MCYVIIAWMKEWQFWIAIASVFGGIFTVCKYLDTRKIMQQQRNLMQQQREFENYHKLIERINKKLNEDDCIFLQVQQAAIFELRFYKRYEKLTAELLKYWANNDELKHFAKDTLDYLNRKYKQK